MSKRKAEFVVGDWVSQDTAEEALQNWKLWKSGPYPSNEPIFRLVKVPLAEVKAQAAREARAKKGARR